MIVNVRGATAAGKSTLVRSIICALPGCFPVVQDGKTFGYTDGTTFIVGPYDIPTGGADVLWPLLKTPGLLTFIQDLSFRYQNIVFEGAQRSGGGGPWVEYASGRKDFVTVWLSATVDQLEGYLADRRRRVASKRTNVANIPRTVGATAKAIAKLEAVTMSRRLLVIPFGTSLSRSTAAVLKLLEKKNELKISRPRRKLRPVLRS